ncbi:hypothetical protein [Methylobacterium durans]|uniref:Uncharacterized protein n=1 Tax=Methylobacterium durans TaxID=2202825 RepID=A0A2U8W309_9HYPH|nr:hypothetical protein [Methylobacterium durans]AWN39742.1 hypothetical protein DK389_03320 [Methylobacterium durans]
MHVLDWLGFTAAFLAALPPGSERPPEGPMLEKPGGRAAGPLTAFVILLLISSFPVAWAMSRAEETFRATCEASGGQIIRVPLSISYVDQCER